MIGKGNRTGFLKIYFLQSILLLQRQPQNCERHKKAYWCFNLNHGENRAWLIFKFYVPKRKKNVRATSQIWSGPKVYWRLISWVCGKPLRVEPIKDCKRRWKPHLRIYSERHNLRAKQGGVALVAWHFFVTENSLLNYRTTLCNCILPYVVVFVIVIVLYKCICFDLRATVGCLVASNLASLPQRLFLNGHMWDSRYIETYPSHSACELSDPGGVQVSLMSSFKSICW